MSHDEHGDAAERFLLSFYFTPPEESLRKAFGARDHNRAPMNGVPMNTITRSEVDSKLETLETKIVAKIDSICSILQNLIAHVDRREKAWDARLNQNDQAWNTRLDQHNQAWNARLDQRDQVIDAKFAHVEARIDAVDARAEARSLVIHQRVDDLATEMKDVKRTLSNQRYWIVGTAVGAVLGVGAFNATVLSNMIAAFESGKSISAAQAQILQRSREMEQALDRVHARLDALPTPLSDPEKQAPLPSSRPQSASRRRRPSARH